MAIPGKPVELRRQIVWLLYWLVGTMGFAFLAGCFLDVGIIIALPVIAIVSASAWIGLTINGLRIAWIQRSNHRHGWLAASASTVAIGIASMIFLPVMRASDFVQAQGVLAFNQRGYEREIERSVAKGDTHKPLTWSYGGFLSTERAIAFSPSGDNPSQHLVKPVGAGSNADCRWLRSSFYDCTIDY